MAQIPRNTISFQSIDYESELDSYELTLSTQMIDCLQKFYLLGENRRSAILNFISRAIHESPSNNSGLFPMSFLTPPEEQSTTFMTEDIAWPRVNLQPADGYSSGCNFGPPAEENDDDRLDALFDEIITYPSTVASPRPEVSTVPSPCQDVRFAGDDLITETLRRLYRGNSDNGTEPTRIKEYYRPALIIMQENRALNDSGSDIAQLAQLLLAVQASYEVLRQDIYSFAKTYVYSWLSGSLWVWSVDTAGEGLSPSQMRSMDVRQLNAVKETEASFMMRRLLRMRLYYWYNKLQNELQGDQLGLNRGETIKSKAIDTILRESYDNWDGLSVSMKKRYRDSFHRDKFIGKKWWSLVGYFSEGITVICAKKMDSIINDSKFKFQSLHCMATFVRNCFPDVQEICKIFDYPWRTLIQKVNIPEVELQKWVEAIDDQASGFEAVLFKMRNSPEAPNPWVTIPEYSNEGITTLMTGFMQQ